MDESQRPDPADAVLTLTLFKADPHCLSYQFTVDGEFAAGTPENLEQLRVAESILKSHIEQAEKTLIGTALEHSRAIRRGQEKSMKLVKIDKGETCH